MHVIYIYIYIYIYIIYIYIYIYIRVKYVFNPLIFSEFWNWSISKLWTNLAFYLLKYIDLVLLINEILLGLFDILYTFQKELYLICLSWLTHFCSNIKLNTIMKYA